MIKMIGRNLFRISLLIFAAGLVMAVIYALSFTPLGEAANRREFYGYGQGKGQLQTQLDGGEYQLEEGEQGYGQGQGQGQGLGRGQGQGFGRWRNDEITTGSEQGYGQIEEAGTGLGYGGNNLIEFSPELGLIKLVRNLIVVTVLVMMVYFLQYLFKRRKRVSPAL